MTEKISSSLSLKAHGCCCPHLSMLCLITLFNLFPPFSVYTSNYIQQDGFHNRKILDLTSYNFGQYLPFLSPPKSIRHIRRQTEILLEMNHYMKYIPSYINYINNCTVLKQSLFFRKALSIILFHFHH